MQKLRRRPPLAGLPAWSLLVLSAVPLLCGCSVAQNFVVQSRRLASSLRADDAAPPPQPVIRQAAYEVEPVVEEAPSGWGQWWRPVRIPLPRTDLPRTSGLGPLGLLFPSSDAEPPPMEPPIAPRAGEVATGGQQGG
jgi:hypothetical protein